MSLPDAHVSFVLQNSRAESIEDEGRAFSPAGERIGEGDPGTFHMQLKKVEQTCSEIVNRCQAQWLFN